MNKYKVELIVGYEIEAGDKEEAFEIAETRFINAVENCEFGFSEIFEYKIKKIN